MGAITLPPMPAYTAGAQSRKNQEEHIVFQAFHSLIINPFDNQTVILP
jgi:3-polyprenyl-4-hydroxybenzoate decarboxylase